MEILSGVRAYVGGEGLWSKGQRDAVYHLDRYARSRARADYELYREAIAVPLGDRKARLELEKRSPDYARARQGFLEGRNHPDDVEAMIRLVRWFRNFDPMDRAIAIWEQADERIVRLAGIAERLNTAVEREEPRPPEIQGLLQELDAVAMEVRPLEDAFSSTLGEGSRDVTRRLVVLLAIVTALLTMLVIWLARDVLHERERHQKNLAESEERYRTFFETSIDAVVLGDELGTVVSVNPAACIAFECSETELKNPTSAWMKGETLDSLRTALREAGREGRFRGNLPFCSKHGKEFVGEVSASRFTSPSGLPRVSVIIRDISERVRAEEKIRLLNASLEERVLERTAELRAVVRDLEINNRELESFCYSVSHDLRLPLRSMSGFSEVLLEDYGPELDETARDHLRRIHAACRRMGRLIDDLLGLTRYTRQKLCLGPVEMDRLVRDCVRDVEAEYPGREVRVVVAADLASPVHADASLLAVLLRSLLSNAWKFSSKTPDPVVEIGSEQRPGEVVFFVRDNGCGFDMAYADRMFDVFHRVHAADEFEGNGIGLALVERIVLRHGGRVWAESRVGEGATFYFTLAPPDEPSSAADSWKSASPTAAA